MITYPYHENRDIAAIYMLKHRKTGKIYIGQTANLRRRINEYRALEYRHEGVSAETHARAIDLAIMNEGFEGVFDVDILVSEKTEPGIADPNVRRIVEAVLISKYNAMNPNHGYNEKDEHPEFDAVNMISRRGFRHSDYTKIKKSEPILVYDRNLSGRVTLYMGSQFCADSLNISDRSIVVSSIKHGKTIHGRTFFKFDYDRRLEDARRIISFKLNARSHGNIMNNLVGSARLSVDNYLEGLRATNGWCREFGFKEVDIDSLLVSIGSSLNNHR